MPLAASTRRRVSRPSTIARERSLPDLFCCVICDAPLFLFSVPAAGSIRIDSALQDSNQYSGPKGVPRPWQRDEQRCPQLRDLLASASAGTLPSSLDGRRGRADQKGGAGGWWSRRSGEAERRSENLLRATRFGL